MSSGLSDAEVATEIEALKQKIAIAEQESPAAAPPMIEATAEPPEPDSVVGEKP